MMAMSFTFSFIGFSALIIAMKRHFSQVQPSRKALSKPQIITVRIIGFTFLIASCVLCINVKGMGIGLVSWTGFLTFTALLQAMLLSYRPHWLLYCGPLFLVFATLSSIGIF